MKESRSNSQLLQSTQQSQWSSQRKEVQKLSAAQIKEFLNESERLGEQNEEFADTLHDKNALEKIMMKQTFLQKNELFDPIDYFGGLKVPDLALTIQDTRLSDMFKPATQEMPCPVSRSKSKETSATSTPSLIKQKSVASFTGLKPTSKYQQSQHQPSPQTSCLQNYPLRSGNKSPPRSAVLQDKENFEGTKKIPTNIVKSHNYSNSTNVLCDIQSNYQMNKKQCMLSQFSTVPANQSTELTHLKSTKTDFLSQINNFNANNNTMTIIQSSSSSPSRPIPQSLPTEQASLHNSSSQTHMKKMSSWAIFAEINQKSKLEESGQSQQDQIVCKNLSEPQDTSPCSNGTAYENHLQPFRTPVEGQNSLSESGISVKDILRGLSNSGSSNKKEGKIDEKGTQILNEKDKKHDKINFINHGINTKTTNISSNIWKKETPAIGFSGRMQMLASMEQLTLETQPQWGNNSQISSNKAGSTVPSSSSSQTSNYSSNLSLVKKAVFNGRADMNRAGSYQLKKQTPNQTENRNVTAKSAVSTAPTSEITLSLQNQPHQSLDPLQQLSLGFTIPITKKSLNPQTETNIIADQHINSIQPQQYLGDNASLFLNRQYRHAPIQALEYLPSLNCSIQNNVLLSSPTVSYYKTTPQQIDSKKILANSGASSASEVVMLTTPLDQQFKNLIQPKLSQDNEPKYKSPEETLSIDNCQIQSSENICNVFRKSSGDTNNSNSTNKLFSMSSLINGNLQPQPFNHILHEDKSSYSPSTGFNSNAPFSYLHQSTQQEGFQHPEQQQQFYSNIPSAYSSISQGMQDISTIPQLLLAPEHLTRAKMFEQKLTSEQFFKDKENLELTFQEDTVPDENECDIPCPDDEEQPEGVINDRTQESYATFCGRTEKCFDIQKNISNSNSDMQNFMNLENQRAQLVLQNNESTVMKPTDDGRVSRLLKNQSISTLNSSNNTKNTSNSRSKTRKENTSTGQNPFQTRGTAYFVGNSSKNNGISQYRSNEVSKLRERDNSNTTKGNTSTQGQVSTSRSNINKSNNNISVIADKSLSSKKITNSISSSYVPGAQQNSLTKKHLHNYLSNRNEGQFISPQSQYTSGNSHSQERSNSAINKSGLLNLGNNFNTSKDTGNYSNNVSQIQQGQQIPHPSSYLKRPSGKTAQQFDYRSSNLCQKTKQPQQDSRAVCSPSCSPSSYKVQAPACQTARPKKIINRLDCSRTYTSAKQISYGTSISISSNVSSLQGGAPSAKFSSTAAACNPSKQIIMIQPSTLSSSSSSLIQEQLEKEMRQQTALESRRQALRVDQKYEGTLQNLMQLQNQKVYQVQSPVQSSAYSLSRI